MSTTRHRFFDSIQNAPPDPILGLTDAFRADPNSGKINLSVGVYQDESGNTPVLDCVKQAEAKLLETEKTKNYLGIHGLPEYTAAISKLLFGADSDVIKNKRAACLQTPGGTGALRVAGDFLKSQFPQAKVWCSTPTWANHTNIFRQAGLGIGSYAYLAADGKSLDFSGLLDSLQQIPAGDVVCLHACCHNPTGVDPTSEQWSQILETLTERNLIPLIDFAYQGFGSGVVEDAAVVRKFADAGMEFLVCNSFSKNFGLYSERVGGLTIVTDNAQSNAAAMSQAKSVVRANYSNPPRHGGSIVATILNDAELSKSWQMELDAMRNRIQEIRHSFVQGMSQQTDKQDFSFIENQSGMFSYSGLTAMQVDELRTRHAIYIVGSGRINVAGINARNLEPLCKAIASVL
jgi:aspartate/tyrosine/aromatic aminotransferase